VIPRAAIMAGAAASAAALCVAIGWSANGWRLSASLERARLESSKYRAEVLAEKASAAERVRKVEGDWNAKYQTAVNAARDRERTLRADLVAVRDASQRLRDQQADAATRIATAPTSTLADYTITLSAVFEDCRAAYAEMGEVAQRHADDARTLIEAWPVNQE